jgi:deoxyadenosine/deoxycytidine kinase
VCRPPPAPRDSFSSLILFADAYVFERLLRKDGHINDVEHAAYQEWWEWLNHKAPATRGIIYLRARPETCLT